MYLGNQAQKLPKAQRGVGADRRGVPTELGVLLANIEDFRILGSIYWGPLFWETTSSFGLQSAGHQHHKLFKWSCFKPEVLQPDKPFNVDRQAAQKKKVF